MDMNLVFKNTTLNTNAFGESFAISGEVTTT